MTTKDNWKTPPWLLTLITEFYEGGWFDPCPDNPTFNGLAIKWPAKTYINPPFSQYLKWAQHGFVQPLEQIWMCDHDHSTERFKTLLPGATLCLLFDRVAFIHPETNKSISSNPRCQTLIYRGNNVGRFKQVFGQKGLV